jgi:hypothetical protein
MKKFIYSVIVFSLLIATIYTIISLIVKPESMATNDYMAAIIDKHNRIDQLNSPKIIFAGGSNLAFGLNSEEIEDELSVPVVNLGLHAGLGLNFILNELKSIIKSGDVVFLSIEYFLDSDGTYKLKKETSNNYKEAQKYYTFDLRNEILINIDETRNNIKSYKKTKKIASNSKPEIEIYSRKAFNKHGDVIAHCEKTPPKELNDRGIFTYRYWSGIDELNDFYSYAKSKNVEVFFIYPNLPITEFKKNQEVISKLSIDLANNLKIEILNRPSDFVFPDSLFFDTVYHLNGKGRELRTKKLIELIKKSTNVQQALEKKADSLPK